MSALPVTHACALCGAPLPEGQRRDTRYCCTAHKQRAYRERVTARTFTVDDFLAAFPHAHLIAQLPCTQGSE